MQNCDKIVNFAVAKLIDFFYCLLWIAKKSIEALQFFATGLTEGALVHKLQGQIFKSQGFEKLGQKYVDHFTEEMKWVEKFYNRIMALGENGENGVMYYLKDATATFFKMMEPVETIKF